jgi:hypothetical protein
MICLTHPYDTIGIFGVLIDQPLSPEALDDLRPKVNLKLF